MTWSFQLSNGDFSLSQTSYGTVTGERKLVQDLRCYILEQMGTDDAHPGFGSLLDGGVKEDGTVVSGVIGMTINTLSQMQIDTELRRIITSYQTNQLQRARDDRTTYGKTTLTRGEVLLGVENIAMAQNQDTLNITLTLQTAADTNIDLLVQIPT